MLTPAVLEAAPRIVEEQPMPACVIWRRSCRFGWDYMCRAPQFDVERVIWSDRFDRGTETDDYKVTQG
jgi:hypothetical protein